MYFRGLLEIYLPIHSAKAHVSSAVYGLRSFNCGGGGRVVVLQTVTVATGNQTARELDNHVSQALVSNYNATTRPHRVRGAARLTGVFFRTAREGL